jgi:hypothetical protein
MAAAANNRHSGHLAQAGLPSVNSASGKPSGTGFPDWNRLLYCFPLPACYTPAKAAAGKAAAEQQQQEQQAHLRTAGAAIANGSNTGAKSASELAAESGCVRRLPSAAEA